MLEKSSSFIKAALLTGALTSQANCGGKVDCDSANVFIIDDTKTSTMNRCANFHDEVELNAQEYPVRLPYYDAPTLQNMTVYKSAEGVRSACKKIMDEDSKALSLGTVAPMMYCDYFKIDEKGEVIRAKDTGNTYTALDPSNRPTIRCDKQDNEFMQYVGEAYEAERGEKHVTFAGREYIEVTAEKGDRFQAMCYMPQSCPAERRSYRCNFWNQKPERQTCDFFSDATIASTKSGWDSSECHLVD